jgi:alkaline phosphatase D
MRFILFVGTWLIFSLSSSAQSLIVAGPMLGYTEYRTSRVWIEVHPATSNLSIQFWAKDKGKRFTKKLLYKEKLNSDFPTATFTLTGLEPGTTYQYEITAVGGGKTEKRTGTVSTQQLWNSRTPAPDLSFITGSCAYTNEAKYDRPGKPYGSDSSIFLTMSKTSADFMLWLGDNWYTREVDYFSAWGLRYRAHHDRSIKVMQPLLKAMPQYAIWDDHDFGPNDFGTSYIFKEESRKVFMDYWANPTYGFEGKGIYTQFVQSDVAFFLLDDRTWRSNDGFNDSINGAPDEEKRMFGRTQMKWLKDALLSNRNATFKIISSGSQMLNPVSPYDCFRHFETEYKELMEFLETYKITGVIFLTGDRHRSEIIKISRPGTYPLYDITVSPLTSRTYEPGGAEKNIPERVEGSLVTTHNFAKVSIVGANGNRVLKIDYFDTQGNKLAQWQTSEKELR